MPVLQETRKGGAGLVCGGGRVFLGGGGSGGWGQCRVTGMRGWGKIGVGCREGVVEWVGQCLGMRGGGGWG